MLTLPRQVLSTNSLHGALPSDGYSVWPRRLFHSISSVFSIACLTHFHLAAMMLLPHSPHLVINLDAFGVRELSAFASCVKISK